MDLSIASLQAAGAFIAPPVKKEVTWHANGKAQTATVYVLQESFISLTQRWDAQDRGGDLAAQRIASCITDKDGVPVFTVDDIVGGPESGHGALCAELAIVLLAAIGEVNQVPEAVLEKIEPEEELWHELAIILGATISEAKRRMTYVEAMDWMRYRRQTGPLNLGLRLEDGFAMLATVFNNAMGGKAKFTDYMPDRVFQAAPKQATPQDLLALLQRVKG